MMFFQHLARPSLAFVFALSVGVAIGAQASTGGPFGGLIGAIQPDHFAPNRVYVATVNGFFRSDDAASNWTAAESGLKVAHPVNNVFTLSSVTPGLLWIFDDAGWLYKSVDNANSWIPTGYTAAMLLDPRSNAIAEGSGGKLWFAANTAGLMVSTDGGATFAPAGGTGFPPGVAVTYVATDPNDRTYVIANTASNCTPSGSNSVCGFYYSADNGTTWTAASIGALGPLGQNQSLSVLAFGPSGSQRIFAMMSTVGIVSNDRGHNWAPTNAYSSYSGIAAAPADANVVWSVSAGEVKKSTDGGVTSSPVSEVGFTTGVYRPNAYLVALASDYATSKRVYIGAAGSGVFTSGNDGATWSYASNGIYAASIDALLVHPTDHSVILAADGIRTASGDTTHGFYRFINGDWEVSNTNLGAVSLNSIVLDPTTTSTVAGTVILAGGNGNNLPQIDTGIYKSTDGGASWTTEVGGLQDDPQFYYAPVLAVTVDPRSCPSHTPTGPLCATGPLQTYYAVGNGAYYETVMKWRVRKSTDGGVTWSSIDSTLPQNYFNPDGSKEFVEIITAIAIDPFNSNTLYIAVRSDGRSAGGQSQAPESSGGVYKSVDAGATWVPMNTGLPTFPGGNAPLQPFALLVDPFTPDTVLVGVTGINHNVAANGVYKSTDGGLHWSSAGSGMSGPAVMQFLADPVTAGTYYAASYGSSAAVPGGVFKTTDSGAHWKSISVNLPASTAYALSLAPADPGDPQSVPILYAGTQGGVYSLALLQDSDGDGIPDAVENSGPNGGDSNFDGIADSQQTNVASTAPGFADSYGWQLGTGAASQAIALNAALAAHANHTDAVDVVPHYVNVAIKGTTCKQAASVEQIPTSELSIDSTPHHGTFTYPNGVSRFELANCAAATVDVRFDQATFGPGWSWRYFGPSTPGDPTTIGWHDATPLVNTQSGNIWTIALTLGAFGSYLPATANSILFEGGPAFSDTIFTDGFQ